MIKDGAVLATFVDIKATKSRKVAVLWFEIPLEEATAALQALGGYPDAVNPKWVGIAPVDAQKVMVKRETEKPKSYAQQVAICCNDRAFCQFLRDKYGNWWSDAYTDNVSDSDIAAQVVRKVCGVVSRSYIIEGAGSALVWKDLYRSYEVWKIL